MNVSPTQDDVFVALRSVLLSVLPAGVDVVLGQANRVPEPQIANYVTMTPGRRVRLRTNSDALDDCRFVGSISGDILSAAAPDWGGITPGRPLWGATVAAGTTILSQLSGTPAGGAGSYRVSATQTAAEQVMACGAEQLEGGYEFVVRLDFHGDGASSDPADCAQTISTVLRDQWAVDQFAALRADVVPLHADEPQQVPFINGEGQFEDRWIVEVHLQINETVDVPQQYMDAAVVGVINVDETYPP